MVMLMEEEGTRTIITGIVTVNIKTKTTTAIPTMKVMMITTLTPIATEKESTKRKTTTATPTMRDTKEIITPIVSEKESTKRRNTTATPTMRDTKIITPTPTATLIWRMVSSVLMIMMDMMIMQAPTVRAAT